MDERILEAVECLKRGELVALPTETVYGLGADATNQDAVEKIFHAKGRPSNNPLIVHVSGENVARRYCRNWTDHATILAKAFWPGPLTMVLEKTASICEVVTAGKSTVGLRAPDHPLAMQLLNSFDGPIAAPSANRSNRVSPTTADHVRQELGDAVAMILDGGPCRVGIESTVLDLTTPAPTILRPGAITQAMLERTLGVRVDIGYGISVPSGVPATSPGQMPVHYAPTTPAYRYFPQQLPRIDPTDAAILPITLDPQAYARLFYSKLRHLDQQHLRAIYIEIPPDHPDWQAMRDRIFRATQPFEP